MFKLAIPVLHASNAVAAEAFYCNRLGFQRDGGCQGRIVGKTAYLKSYKEFTSRAFLHGYNEAAPTIELWNETAICSYRFEIDYEMDGERFRKSGQDLRAFVRQGGRWLAVWRAMMAQPAPP